MSEETTAGATPYHHALGKPSLPNPLLAPCRGPWRRECHAGKQLRRRLAGTNGPGRSMPSG